MSPLSFFHKLSHAWKIIFTVNPFQLFSELGTKYNSGLCQKKKKESIFFQIWDKLRSPVKATFKNSKISLWIEKNFEGQPKANAKKSQSWIYGWIWKCYVPNLHKTKLPLYQTEWMRYIITSNFENLSMNCEKYVFYWKNRILNPSCIGKAPNKSVDNLMYYPSKISWWTRS